MREEVESLLTAMDRAGNFIEQPAFDTRSLSASFPAGWIPVLAGRALKPGDSVGPYAIVEFLGAGGMGEVYRAHDPDLNRDVALKVRPAAFALDDDRFARFRREAQILAALNHPNVAAIFSLEDSGGVQALVLELVEGATLADRIRKGRMAIGEALSIVKQIAHGLEAAHNRGIIHSDLKPANIKLRPDGTVKILDFGLAKALDAVDATTPRAAPPVATPVITQAGLIFGTAAYMSPEQARGEAVDKRTDIWAFGCVLFEMLAGRSVFRGESIDDVLAAVLRHEPEWSLLPAETPAGIVRLLRRCLEKTADRRLRDIGDARIEIEEALSPTAAVVHKGRRPRSFWIMSVAAGIGIVVAGWAWLLHERLGGADQIPRLMNTVKLTTALGVEDFPSWSPDGRALAYQSDQAGNWDIWVTQPGSREAINRTADSSAFDGYPAWSPDGQWIAFFSNRDGGGYYVMPGVGGPARKVASWPIRVMFRTTTAQWSPDGSQLAYPQAQGQGAAPSIEILTLSSGVSRTLPLPAKPLNNAVFDIRWSPDGRWLAYRRAVSEVSATAELWLTRVTDGTSIQLTDGTTRDWSPGWSADSRTLFFLSTRGGASDLWRFVVNRDGNPAGEPQQVTAGIEMVNAVLSADGRKLAYSKGRKVRNVFRVPILTDRPATWADARQLTFDEADFESVDVSRDGRLVLSSDRSGNWDLWTMPSSGGELQQITRDAALNAGPRWKPDGKELVFYSTRGGHRQIWIMPLDAGPARQLSKDEATYPSWSPDGREIVEGTDAGATVIAAGNGERRILLNEPAYFVEWSPNGMSVLFRGVSDSSLWQVPATGGQHERLTKGGATIGRWSPDGKQIYFIGLQAHITDEIWQLSLSDREERPVTALAGRRGVIGGSGLATDGKYLYFTWEESLGDIWAADIKSARNNRP